MVDCSERNHMKVPCVQEKCKCIERPCIVTPFLSIQLNTRRFPWPSVMYQRVTNWPGWHSEGTMSTKYQEQVRINVVRSWYDLISSLLFLVSGNECPGNDVCMHNRYVTPKNISRPLLIQVSYAQSFFNCFTHRFLLGRSTRRLRRRLFRT